MSSYRFLAELASSPEIADERAWGERAIAAFHGFDVWPYVIVGKHTLTMSFELDCLERATPDELLDQAVDLFTRVSRESGISVPSLMRILAVADVALSEGVSAAYRDFLTTDLTDLYMQRQLES